MKFRDLLDTPSRTHIILFMVDALVAILLSLVKAG